jgi:hypothetical protein
MSQKVKGKQERWETKEEEKEEERTKQMNREICEK